jgi:bacteriocin-like protein
MSKITVHDSEANLDEVHELTNNELDVVSGGGKQKSDGTAAGNVAAKWSLAQGAAA